MSIPAGSSEERERAKHLARADHYSFLSRRGDPARRCNPVEEDFNAGWDAALAAASGPVEDTGRESEWDKCVKCGREDWDGVFVELVGTPHAGNPDGGTGDPICPQCIERLDLRRDLARLREAAQKARDLASNDKGMRGGLSWAKALERLRDIENRLAAALAATDETAVSPVRSGEEET